MHSSQAGSYYLMAQSCHSPRVYFVLVLLVNYQGPHFVVYRFFFPLLFIQIHVLIITEAIVPVFQFLLLCELKNKDSIHNCFFFFTAWLIRFINVLYGESNSHRTSLINKSNCYADYRHSSQSLKSTVFRVISNLVHSIRKQLCFLALPE